MNGTEPVPISTDSPVGFAGNSDIYGVGIRIGYYTQALSSTLASFLSVPDTRTQQTLNLIFLLALAIGVLLYASNTSTTYAIEVFLLLQIGLCLGFVNFMQRGRYWLKYLGTGVERNVVRMILLAVGWAFNVWFWWRGIDSLLSTPGGSYFFFWVKVPLETGGGRTAMKVLVIVMGVFQVLLPMFGDSSGLVRHWRLRNMRKEFVGAAEKYTSEEKELDRPKESQEKSKATFRSTCNDENLEGEGISSSKTSTLAEERVLDGEITARPGQIKALKSQVSVQINETPKIETNSIGGWEREQKTTMDLGSLHRTQVHPDEVTFPSVYEAEEYLNLVFPAKSKATSSHSRKTCWPLSTKNSEVTEGPNDHQIGSTGFEYYRTTVKRMVRAFCTEANRRGVANTLGNHAVCLGLSFNQWLRTVNRMSELEACRPLPNWRILAVASDIQASQMPTVVPLRRVMLVAVQSFLFIALLIVQVELTIVWNNIHGLQGPATVGQLIPLIIGVGGLLNVFLEKWRTMQKKKHGVEEETVIRGPYEKAIEKYLRWKCTRDSTQEHTV